jgi:alkanesulfonate monooxygenase SsuD/methylene tetrahydromethanopterin reductase-like flavin-dependent oxidoreductase (luciferase family)
LAFRRLPAAGAGRRRSPGTLGEPAFWSTLVTALSPDVGLGGPLKPFQKPHPPIAVPGMTAQSRLMRAAGERGWAPLSSNLAHARVVKHHWDQVTAGALQAGRTAERSTWRIAREVYVDETNAEARAYVKRSSLAHGYEDYFFKMFARSGQNVLWKDRDDLPTSDLTLEYMIDNMWLVGDPDSVANQIRELYEEVGGFGTLLWVTHDWDDADRWRRSMRLLAQEVMPRLADLS